MPRRSDQKMKKKANSYCVHLSKHLSDTFRSVQVDEKERCAYPTLCCSIKNYTPSLPSIHIPFMVPVPDVWAEPMQVTCCCRLDIPISQERKSILVSVYVVVVFPARILDRFEKVNRLRPVR